MTLKILTLQDMGSRTITTNVLGFLIWSKHVVSLFSPFYQWKNFLLPPPGTALWNEFLEFFIPTYIYYDTSLLLHCFARLNDWIINMYNNKMGSPNIPYFILPELCTFHDITVHVRQLVIEGGKWQLKIREKHS